MREAWSRVEVEASVADYFHMLTLELAGQKYSKTEHRSTLLRLLNRRTEAAVELKHQNISAILNELGWPFIPGYKPARNYQRLLYEVVADRIRRDVDIDRTAIVAADMPAAAPVARVFRDVMVNAPRLSVLRQPKHRPPFLDDFSSMKRDYVARESRNVSLGRAGEEFVLDYERWRLINAGRRKLAEKVEHVASTKGDGLGFDVLSFETSGRDRLIEVKTTAFAKETPFFVTRTEVERSRANASLFFLYRLFEFRSEPRMFSLRGAVENHCVLDPITYRAAFS